MRSVDLFSRIQVEARRLKPGRALLNVLGVLPYLLGWLVGKAAVALWVVLAWLWTATQIGFDDARRRLEE